jgi:imidazole glycerol-phosphate synthase subunit HisH
VLGIIDYGSGNIAALTNIFRLHKIPHFVSSKASELHEAQRFLLPGVGAFDPTMETLTKSGLVEFLQDQVIGAKKPILGICVGMQLLAESSDEGNAHGLGFIAGRVRRIDIRKLNQPPHLPHMGWNSIAISENAKLFAGVDAKRGFYFLHSFYFDATNSDEVAATTTYGDEIPCAVQRGNIFGAQFHPEKSHSNGVQLLKNFAGLN